MGYGASAPVITGLAVGIAFIVLLTSFTRLTFTMSDEEIRQKVRKLPEVQAFYQRYTPLEQVKHEGTATYVEYQIGRTWNFGNDPTCNCDDITKSLRLTVKVNSLGKTS